MTIRISPTQLIAGAVVVGNSGLGVLGSAVPSGGDAGASYLYNDLSLPADNNVEVRGLIITPPSAGTFFAFEDGSFTLTGAPDGNYSFVYRLFADGVNLGTATATVMVGVALVLVSAAVTGLVTGVASAAVSTVNSVLVSAAVTGLVTGVASAAVSAAIQPPPPGIRNISVFELLRGVS